MSDVDFDRMIEAVWRILGEPIARDQLERPEPMSRRLVMVWQPFCRAYQLKRSESILVDDHLRRVGNSRWVSLQDAFYWAVHYLKTGEY